MISDTNYRDNQKENVKRNYTVQKKTYYLNLIKRVNMNKNGIIVIDAINIEKNQRGKNIIKIIGLKKQQKVCLDQLVVRMINQ